MNKRNHSRKPVRKRFSLVQKIILGVIVVASITIVIATISVLNSRPENIVKSKIETLASDYYENVIYQGILDSKQFSGDITETLQKYTETGLSPVTLRELLLHDTKKSADFSSLIKEYCNQEMTTVKYYPEAPFAKSSYRVVYSYSCDF